MQTKSSVQNISDMDLALSDLKKNKSRDHLGYVNELYKEGVIGVHLKNSLLTMMNLLKQKKLIASVPKRRSQLEPKNERVIFRVCVFRNILMHLIYNMKYSG